MKNRTIVGFFLSLFIITLLTACGNGEDSTSSKSNNTGDEDSFKFAFLPNTQNNTFQVAMHDTFKKLAEENGYSYTMLDPDYDLNTQINQMLDVAQQGYDAVFIIPVDSAGIRQGLEELKNNNIPVFNVDTPVIKEDRELIESVIATDAYMAGKLMGEQMVKDFPDGAKIAILDFPENESCVKRVKGFLDGLGNKVGKFDIVAQQNGKAALDDSLKLAEDIIQANPDLKAFFAINDPSALGVVAAKQALERDDIAVYSIDASPEGKEALLDGSFTAVSAQVPIQIAEESFKEAVEYLKGGEVEKEILLPSFVVSKEQAKETAGKWQ